MTRDKRWQALFERVQELVAEQLAVKIDMVDSEASIIDDLGADSLDQVELVMALEEAFEIEVPDEVAEKMTTVGNVVDYLHEGGINP